MKPLVVFYHQNTAVFLTDNHLFMADGYDGVKYDTAEGIKSYIERTLKQKAKLAKPTMQLEVCDESGHPMILHGLNAGTGYSLTEPRLTTTHTRLYPYNEQVVNLLARCRQTRNRLQKIETALNRLTLSNGWQSGDGRDNDEDRLKDAYKRIETEHAEKTKMCEKLPEFLDSIAHLI